MPYFLVLADSRPSTLVDAYSLKTAPRIGFLTETEAVDHACQLLKEGKFVAAIERPDGTLITPAQIAERCNPLARLDMPTR